MRRFIQIGLGLLVCLTAGAAIGAKPNSNHSPADLVALVKQLGAPQYIQREIASRRLRQAGSAAKALLEQAAQSPDAEVRRRAAEILAAVRRSEFDAALRTFIADDDGSQGVELPAWQTFRNRLGSDRSARALFVEMQRSEAALLAAYAGELPAAGKALEQRCLMLATGMRHSAIGGRRQIDLGTVASILLVASDPQVPVSDATARLLYTFVYQPSFNTGMQNPLKRDLLRQILGGWIVKNLSASNNLGYQNFILAMRYDVSEGLGPAIEMLGKESAAPSFSLYAILTIGKFGNREHLDVLQPLLKNESVCTTTNLRTQQNGKQVVRRVNIEVRDAALAVMLRLSDLDPKEFGYPAVQENKYYLLSPQSLYFPDAEAREAALAKWEATRAATTAN